MSDKKIILKIKNGEINYFEFLVKKYSKYIYNYFFLKLKNKEDCEDLIQDVFLNFYRTLNRFDEEKPVFPYLIEIAKNQLKMFYRRKKFTLSLKDKLIAENDYLKSLNLFDDLGIDLSKLNKKEKKIFKLLGEGYKIKEIARILKIKENTVKSMIRRGRIKIKSQTASDAVKN